jgi:CRISPR-associated endonuclease Csn1
MGRRFSFDIGTNSIGWAVWRTGPDPKLIFGEDAPLELLGAGVRLFKDGRNPKDGQSLAAMRRVPKQARKRRDRFVLRREALTAALVDAGLMPAKEDERRELVTLDPYQLRAKGLDEALRPHEFGRALFHLHQRRGFQSNRKAERKASDKDAGKIAPAILELRKKLDQEGCKTLGQFLWKRHAYPDEKRDSIKASHSDSNRKPDLRAPALRQSTRIRQDSKSAGKLYEFYPSRQMLREEFDALWEAQAKHHPELLTPEAGAKIRTILFRQRPLKPPRIGFCTFEHDAKELRLPKALPSVQAREIYERLGHLRISTGRGTDRPLLPEERDALATVLLTKDKMTFTQIKKALKLGGEVKINFEETGEKELLGLRTSRLLLQEDHYGPRWRALSWAEKDAFVTKLLDEEDEEKLVARLMQEDGLSRTAAENCASIPLPDGYSRLGAAANAAILEALVEERDENGFVITYDKAVRRAGERLGRNWHHSDERDGELLDRLPYYGKALQRHVLPGTFDPADAKDEAKFYGRIMNPSVHIGLNQLRRVVNALIAEYGEPDQIVVELARELKMTAKQKEEEQKRNRENRAANERRAKQLDELNAEFELRLGNTGENRARLKLYEQAEKAWGFVCCPFSGRKIGAEKLFSSEIEIEHLLPWSRTFDDTPANKVLCYRESNRLKGSKTPFEHFGNTPEWNDILARADKLPKNKRWRFQPDAMEQFKAASEGKMDKKTLEKMGLTNGFLARHLNETKHMSRLAKAYLGKVCDPNSVYVTPGTLTGMLSRKWGLNTLLPDYSVQFDKDGKKVRTDHRHHMIDAIVIGAMTRKLLLHLSIEAGRAEESDFKKVIDRIEPPFEGFRETVREQLRKVVVSNKPEHGKLGELHEETAYGRVSDSAEASVIGGLVFRKPLTQLTPGEVDRIRDSDLRVKVQAAVAAYRQGKGGISDKNGYADALAAFAKAHSIRRIRVGKKDASAVDISGRTGRPYKAVSPGANHHIDIVQMRDGSWKGFAATVFDVNRKGWRPSWEREKLGGKLVMRLHKGDAVELESSGVRVIKNVQQIWAKENLVVLAEHNEGGDLDGRHKTDNETDPFRWDFANIGKLKDRGCRAVRVGDTGRIERKPTNL